VTSLSVSIVLMILVYDSGAGQNDLKKCYTKIQACNWDQNKSWMSCLEKIINLKK
jgi:hypothetical protein